MPFHDAYARRTPFELVFADEDAVARLGAEVTEQAEELGIDPSSRAAFPAVPAVSGYLEEVRGPGTSNRADQDYAELLFHALHFDRSGRPLFLLSTPALRGLVGRRPTGAEADLPAGAGYLQFPQHLLWIEGRGDAAAESVDGICWTLGRDGLLHLLVASGMRDDRPGLGVFRVPEAPWEHAPEWVEAEVREGEEDFANVLPGGELEGLHAFRAAGEVLKLFARFCILLAGGSARVTLHGPAEEVADTPIPSLLPYRRVETDA